MTSPSHEIANLRLVQKYFESLPSDDISRRYAAGEKYQGTFLSRFKLFFSLDSTLSELNKFYPYQPIVERTYEMFKEERSANRWTAGLISAITVYFPLHSVPSFTPWPSTTMCSPSSVALVASSRLTDYSGNICAFYSSLSSISSTRPTLPTSIRLKNSGWSTPPA